jgi:6-phosphofructokinase 1
MTGGGDCPGLNAVIRSVVKRATGLGHEILGIEDAFRGLLDPGPLRVRTLDHQSISGLLPRGGTMLGTSNRANPFRFPVKEGGSVVERDLSRLAVQRLRELGVEGLLCAGGDGSMNILCQLADLGLKGIGIPKTIDNDLNGTDQTFGFDTARNIATDAVDKLHTTAESHDRVMVLEVMGRNAGFLALESGLAGGADVILIPEIPWRAEAVLAAIRRRQANGRSFSIAVVAEGAAPLGGGQSVADEADRIPGRGVVRLGGAGKVLADAIAAHIDLEVRVTVLGHLQRGGSPSPYDRLLGSRCGAHAVTLADRGQWNRVVVLKGTEITDVALSPEVTRQRSVDPHGELCRLARQLGVSLGE